MSNSELVLSVCFSRSTFHLFYIRVHSPCRIFYDFNEGIMTCTHHYNVIQGSFTSLKNLCVLLIPSSLPARLPLLFQSPCINKFIRQGSQRVGHNRATNTFSFMQCQRVVGISYKSHRDIQQMFHESSSCL